MDIILHDEFLQSGIINEKFVLRLFFWLVSHSKYSDGILYCLDKNNRLNAPSNETMSKEMKITIKSLRNSLKKLVEYGFIDIYSDGNKKYITIQDSKFFSISVKECKRASERAGKRAAENCYQSNCVSNNYDDEKNTKGQVKGQVKGQLDTKEKNEKKENFPPHTPLYKEKKEKKENFVIITRAREDEFDELISDFKNQQITVEQFCMSESITKDEFFEFAAQTINEWRLVGEEKNNKVDAKKHLLNSIRIKSRQKYGNTNYQTQRNYKRGCVETDAVRAEDYEGKF